MRRTLSLLIIGMFVLTSFSVFLTSVPKDVQAVGGGNSINAVADAGYCGTIQEKSSGKNSTSIVSDGYVEIWGTTWPPTNYAWNTTSASGKVGKQYTLEGSTWIYRVWRTVLRVDLSALPDDADMRDAVAQFNITSWYQTPKYINFGLYHCSDAPLDDETWWSIDASSVRDINNMYLGSTPSESNDWEYAPLNLNFVGISNIMIRDTSDSVAPAAGERIYFEVGLNESITYGWPHVREPWVAGYYVPRSTTQSTSVFYSEDNTDGFLDYRGYTYPPYSIKGWYNGSWTYPGNPTTLLVGQWRYGYNVTDRGYVNFDTHSLAGETILSVTLAFRTSSLHLNTNFDLQLWSTKYNGTPDAYGDYGTPAWNATGSKIKDIMNTSAMSANTWYTTSIPASYLNISGFTGFMFNSSRDSKTMPATSVSFEYIEIQSAYNPLTSYPLMLNVTYAMTSVKWDTNPTPYGKAPGDYIWAGQANKNTADGAWAATVQARGFMGFDTTTIPIDATVTSAVLYGWNDVGVLADVGHPWQLDVYSSNATSFSPLFWDGEVEYQNWIYKNTGYNYGYYNLGGWGGYAGCSVSPYSIKPGGFSTYIIETTTISEYPYGAPTYSSDVQMGFEGTSTPPPYLNVSYEQKGVTFSIQLLAGTYLNSTNYPEVTDWNLTHDLYEFEFSTVPNADNVTIFKPNQLWQFASVVPACNYTESTGDVTLTDVYDSIDYRMWFTVPKLFAYTAFHIALYNAFTGEGIFWEAMRVVMNAGTSYNNTTAVTVVKPDIEITVGEIWFISVLDYFGNYVTGEVATANAIWKDLYISVPIYNYKFYNQNPSFALLRVYYNLTGQPYSEFIPPNDYVERLLKTGTYRFNITFYNETGVQGNTYTWVRDIPNPTFPGAGFVILTGTTIAEVIAAVNGMQALVQVVAELVTPSVLWMGRDIPQIPSYLLSISNTVIVNNLYMLSASTNQLGSGTLMNFSTPIPTGVQDHAIARDYFRFNGPLATTVFINDTGTGFNAYNSATLPPSIAVSGSGAYRVDTSNSVSCSREVDFRWYKVFTWKYYPSDNNKYEAEITLQNTLATDWMNATLFIPFMNGSAVNNQSVQIFDMNNTVFLTEGLHWVQSAQGVYMWFSQWNASVWRGFKLTYNSLNETTLQLPVHIIVATVGDATGITYIWQKDTFYFAKAAWTNDYRRTYHGSIYIDLTFDMSVDSTTVKVLTPNGNVITDVIVAGKTIIIPEVLVSVGDKIEFTILFKTVQKANILDMEFANIPIVVTAGFIALASFILGIFFIQFKKGDKRAEAWGRMFIGLAVLALMLVVVVFIYFLGIMA